MNRTGLIAILGTGVILALILLVSNFNIQININSKDDEASANQSTTSTTGATQTNAMADHHGGGATDVLSGLLEPDCCFW